MALKVLHLSTYDTNGGAARAAYSLHRAMLSEGLNSQMWVARKGSSDPTVHERGSRLFRLTSAADRQLWRLQRSPLETWRSPARFACLTAKEINRSDANVVNLHWITDGFLSIEEIGKITKPIVWSMYDMWPFSGTEHYGPDGPNARWRLGYSKASRLAAESRFDLDSWAFQRKLKHWSTASSPIHMIPASTWLEEATRDSTLMGNWRIKRIPHVVDTHTFSPMNREQARRELGIPNEPTLLFMSSAGIRDMRKGFDLFEQALPDIKARLPHVQLVIAGPREANYSPPVNVPVIWLGHLYGNNELRRAYCASDVLVVPSREDNMPLTAMEAQSCGRPVVAFSNAGLPDIVDHLTTGFLAETDDTEGIAQGTITAITDSGERDQCGQSARQRALSMWSPEVIVKNYKEIYDSLK